jgi:hypothetical protein
MAEGDHGGAACFPEPAPGARGGETHDGIAGRFISGIIPSTAERVYLRQAGGHIVRGSVYDLPVRYEQRYDFRLFLIVVPDRAPGQVVVLDKHGHLLKRFPPS